MTIEREYPAATAHRPERLPAPRHPDDESPIEPSPVGRAASSPSASTLDRFGLAGIGALTGGWLTYSWQFMGKPFVDAVAETVGGVSAVLLVVSMIGTARHSRR